MHHTDLLNRMIKDELDLPMFEKILDALESIENGNETQESASTNIGQMLADLYVNSALKQKQNSDETESNTTKTIPPVKNITWKEYKQSLRK
jgi:phosphoketolase